MTVVGVSKIMSECHLSNKIFKKESVLMQVLRLLWLIFKEIKTPVKKLKSWRLMVFSRMF